MHCLIVSATAIEIKPFMAVLPRLQQQHPGLELDVLISGIGLTATTYALTRYLSMRRPGFIIQAGLGGCFATDMPLGTVVAVKKETIADQSVMELNELKTLFDLKLVPANQHPFKKGWLVNQTPLLQKLPFKRVTGISVNEITTQRKKVAFYREHFNPVVESMEGAALHYTALMEGIPFVQLRSMSNYIAERNKAKWNMQTSIETLNLAIANTLPLIEKYARP